MVQNGLWENVAFAKLANDSSGQQDSGEQLSREQAMQRFHLDRVKLFCDVVGAVRDAEDHVANIGENETNWSKHVCELV